MTNVRGDVFLLCAMPNPLTVLIYLFIYTVFIYLCYFYFIFCNLFICVLSISACITDCILGVCLGLRVLGF